MIRSLRIGLLAVTLALAGCGGGGGHPAQTGSVNADVRCGGQANCGNGLGTGPATGASQPSHPTGSAGDPPPIVGSQDGTGTPAKLPNSTTPDDGSDGLTNAGGPTTGNPAADPLTVDRVAIAFVDQASFRVAVVPVANGKVPNFPVVTSANIHGAGVDGVVFAYQTFTTRAMTSLGITTTMDVGFADGTDSIVKTATPALPCSFYCPDLIGQGIPYSLVFALPPGSLNAASPGSTVSVAFLQ